MNGKWNNVLISSCGRVICENQANFGEKFGKCGQEKNIIRAIATRAKNISCSKWKRIAISIFPFSVL